MNLLLLQPGEIAADGTVTLADRRADHLRGVLHAQPGQVLRAGLLNGARGTATVRALAGGRVVLGCDLSLPPLPPTGLSLILAVPRPKAMRRLWPQLAALGVDRIVLVNAGEVDRNYFDTHWLEPAHYTPLLCEGLEQCGDTRLPQVSVRRRLKPFVEDEIESLFAGHARWLAQPAAAEREAGRTGDGRSPAVLAVGPEGGWTEYEVGLFVRKGFETVSLGPRTLRVDTACVALLGAFARASRVP